MFWNIINEAYNGNFSYFILIVNILQLGVGIAALIVAIIALKRKDK